MSTFTVTAETAAGAVAEFLNTYCSFREPAEPYRSDIIAVARTYVAAKLEKEFSDMVEIEFGPIGSADEAYLVEPAPITEFVAGAFSGYAVQIDANYVRKGQKRGKNYVLHVYQNVVIFAGHIVWSAA